jgi:hypothetical protein
VPRSRKKKSQKAAGKPGQHRPGMPAEASVQEVLHFVSPDGVEHEILRTNETDAYDPPLESAKKGGGPALRPKR